MEAARAAASTPIDEQLAQQYAAADAAYAIADLDDPDEGAALMLAAMEAEAAAEDAEMALLAEDAEVAGWLGHESPADSDGSSCSFGAALPPSGPP